MATYEDIAATGAAPARPRTLVVLHWLTVLCLLGAASAILVRDEVSGRVARQWLLEIHRHFGLFVLALFFVRTAMRAGRNKWPSITNTSLAMRAVAALVHIALYALLLIQPVLGWALSSAQGKPVHLFGMTLPALAAADEDRADALQTWHTNVAWLLLALILLHMGGALWHHFVLRDGVLRAMLPRRKRR